MADNFLERQRRDYEERKQAWAKNKLKHSKPSQLLRRASERYGDE